MVTKKKGKKKTLRDIMRRRLLSGLAVVVPAALTILILQFLYDLTVGRLTPVTRSLFESLPGYIIPVGSLAFLAVLTYVTGIVASIVVGRRVIRLAETVLEQIPVVKTIYSASKQAVQMLSASDASSNFKSVVIVDFPRPGMKSLAFVTGKVILEDIRSHEAREHYSVFVPTTPNPTSGYLEFIPVDTVQASGISVEDAIKSIMSGGLIIPAAYEPQSGETEELLAESGDSNETA